VKIFLIRESGPGGACEQDISILNEIAESIRVQGHEVVILCPIDTPTPLPTAPSPVLERTWEDCWRSIYPNEVRRLEERLKKELKPAGGIQVDYYPYSER
jgi:thioesterase domain-containing protein